MNNAPKTTVHQFRPRSDAPIFSTRQVSEFSAELERQKEKFRKKSRERKNRERSEEGSEENLAEKDCQCAEIEHHCDYCNLHEPTDPEESDDEDKLPEKLQRLVDIGAHACTRGIVDVFHTDECDADHCYCSEEELALGVKKAFQRAYSGFFKLNKLVEPTPKPKDKTSRVGEASNPGPKHHKKVQGYWPEFLSDAERIEKSINHNYDVMPDKRWYNKLANDAFAKAAKYPAATIESLFHVFEGQDEIGKTSGEALNPGPFGYNGGRGRAFPDEPGGHNIPNIPLHPGSGHIPNEAENPRTRYDDVKHYRNSDDWVYPGRAGFDQNFRATSKKQKNWLHGQTNVGRTSGEATNPGPKKGGKRNTTSKGPIGPRYQRNKTFHKFYGTADLAHFELHTCLADLVTSTTDVKPFKMSKDSSRNTDWLLDPNSASSPYPLSVYGNLFVMYKINEVILHYSTVSGSSEYYPVAVAYYDDPAIPTNESATYNTYTTLRNQQAMVAFPTWKSVTLKVPKNLLGGWRFRDTVASPSQSDLRFTSPGLFCGSLGSTPTTNGVILGEWYISFYCQFKQMSMTSAVSMSRPFVNALRGFSDSDLEKVWALVNKALDDRKLLVAQLRDDEEKAKAYKLSIAIKAYQVEKKEREILLIDEDRRPLSTNSSTPNRSLSPIRERDPGDKTPFHRMETAK